MFIIIIIIPPRCPGAAGSPDPEGIAAGAASGSGHAQTGPEKQPLPLSATEIWPTVRPCPELSGERGFKIRKWNIIFFYTTTDK